MTVLDRGPRLEDVSLENDDFAERVPHETFALLRREAPVWWYDWPLGRGYWCVTKHADVVAVSRDTKTFTSEQGANLEDLDEEQRAARQSMLETDPPRHARLRGLVGPPFTPRAIKAYELVLRELTAAVLDRALPLREFDFIEEVAKQLPIRVLARLLGAPDEDNDRLIDWGDRMIGNTDPELADVLSDTPESDQYRMLPFRSPASVELFEYAHRIADARRAAPTDDLVSKLVNAEIDGERLTEREFDTMFLLLVVAGNETTRQAIAHGMLALAENRDQWQCLTDDPELVWTAGADEILRWSSPVLHFRRTATRDVEVGGQTIRAGDKVVIWYVSANFDEGVFADPLRFDVGRRPNPHVTFGGGGPHFCLGAHLAKLEIRVWLEEMVPYLTRLELAGEPVRLRSNFFNGVKRLPVRIVR
jgi:cytochrome P450